MADDGSAQSTSVWPIPKFRFEVKWDSAVMSFQEVSGLDVEAQPIEYRAGDSATFYSWLLGPGSGSSVTDWNPVSLLFDHGVCGIRSTGDDGPHPSWVPVISTDDPARTLRLSADSGYGHVQRESRTYLTRGPDWLRIVPRDPLPSFGASPFSMERIE